MNNPIRFIDPDGMRVGERKDGTIDVRDKDNYLDDLKGVAAFVTPFVQ